ncbi:MAG TPA: NADP-dependent oxidoreductase [Solirubrobacteraceae bacterium]|nr:NADP-dependent oxidoreductase [Solirubrobacteraceae bacterium]
MADRNRRMILAERPTGVVDTSTVRLEEGELPQPGEGEALARVRYLSIDPTIRTWMDDAPGYLPPIEIGEVVRSGGIAEIVESNTEDLHPGELVFGFTGWQDYVVASKAGGYQPLPQGTSPTLALSLFGVTGMTAYFGLIDVGRVAAGDVVVVSGAAGATGSTVGQIAKIKDAANVIGIAGGPEKCRHIVEDLGFDEAIDYKNEDVAKRLREAAPDGIDLYFDNVGGEILDACLAQLALRGRIVLCGAIASYNDRHGAVGPANYSNLIIKRGRMEGFLILDYFDRLDAARAEMAVWLGEGRIKSSEHVVKGLENAIDALNLLFTGGNTGKVMVEV